MPWLPSVKERNPDGTKTVRAPFRGRKNSLAEAIPAGVRLLHCAPRRGDCKGLGG